MGTPDSLDPRLLQALNLAEDYWKLGDPPIDVQTASGSEYHITTDGLVTRLWDGPSTEERPEVSRLRLSGSVYRQGGPIRPGVVVYGLRLELAAEPGRTITTSLVTGISTFQVWPGA